MISESLKFLVSQFELIDIPSTRNPGGEVYKVDWTKVASNNVKGDYFAVFAGFAYPLDHQGEIDLTHLAEAYDLIGEGECVRVILTMNMLNTARSDGYMVRVEGRDKTKVLLKRKS
jgi:hypothetical protein